jgi:aryl carrier-like protein
VLRVDGDLDYETNFFDAGGSSLLLLELQREFETSLGSAVSVVELFKFTTIKAQAELLGRA